MKVIQVFLTLCLLVVITSPLSTVYAQQEQAYDYDRAYQDYVFAMDVYQRKNSDYLLARSQYLQAGTLVSQTKAHDATVAMLEARDDAVVLYLNAVKFKLNETLGAPSVARDGLVERLGTEIAWFQDHKAGLSSAGSLNELAKDSKKASDRFEDSQVVAYETLVTVANGKVTDLRDQLNNINTDLRQKTFEIKAKGDYDIGDADRWFLEIDNKMTRSLDKSIEADSSKANFYDTRINARSGFLNSIISGLLESEQQLREASGFLKEIIRTIISPA